LIFPIETFSFRNTFTTPLSKPEALLYSLKPVIAKEEVNPIRPTPAMVSPSRKRTALVSTPQKEWQKGKHTSSQYHQNSYQAHQPHRRDPFQHFFSTCVAKLAALDVIILAQIKFRSALDAFFLLNPA